MEQALQKIQEKRDSLEVTLTLELLKHGRRFHAVVSFDADTGLQHTMDLVTDYCILMKDFPIQELLTATTLDKIRDAIRQIFAHMRKIRNTKYPVTRCQYMIEALSRDVTSQMLKVYLKRVCLDGFQIESSEGLLCIVLNVVFFSLQLFRKFFLSFRLSYDMYFM